MRPCIRGVVGVRSTHTVTQQDNGLTLYFDESLIPQSQTRLAMHRNTTNTTNETCCGRLGPCVFDIPTIEEQRRLLLYRCEMPTHSALLKVGTRVFQGAQYLSTSSPEYCKEMIGDLYAGVRLAIVIGAVWHRACAAGTSVFWSEKALRKSIEVREELARQNESGEKKGGEKAEKVEVEEELHRTVLCTAWFRLGWGMVRRAYDADRACAVRCMDINAEVKGCSGMVPALCEQALDFRSIKTRHHTKTCQAFAVLIAVNHINMGITARMEVPPQKWYRGESPHGLLGWDGVNPISLKREPPHLCDQWRDGIGHIEYGVYVMSVCETADLNGDSMHSLQMVFKKAEDEDLPWVLGKPFFIPTPPFRSSTAHMQNQQHNSDGSMTARGFYDAGVKYVERGLRQVLAAYGVPQC